MVPLAFSITSHLSSTLACAIFIWASVISMGFSKHELLFFKIILPKGIPYRLVPFLIFVEFISYIFRVVSLSLRLFANVLAGHILLHVVSGFIFSVLANSIYGLTPIIFLTAISLLLLLVVLFLFEIMVAMLQSYIFLVLSLIYLQDINNLAH
jgi:ATP synthase subunit 6